MTVLFRKWVSIVPVLVCFPIIVLTVGHGMAQPPVAGSKNAPGHVLYAAKGATFTPGHHNVTNRVRTNVPMRQGAADMSGSTIAKMIGRILEMIIPGLKITR